MESKQTTMKPPKEAHANIVRALGPLVAEIAKLPKEVIDAANKGA